VECEGLNVEVECEGGLWRWNVKVECEVECEGGMWRWTVKVECGGGM
jgi:hypothetical protein